MYNTQVMDTGLGQRQSQTMTLAPRTRLVSYERKGYDIKEVGTNFVTYTVTPGGVRAKAAAMTGIRVAIKTQ